MSHMIKYLRQIEELGVNQLADALEFNGYAECVGAIRSKSIDGEQFLKLTEVHISLWRLPTSQTRRLWSFIQQMRQDPTQFLLNDQVKMVSKVKTANKSSDNLPATSHSLIDKPLSFTKPNLPRNPKPVKATGGDTSKMNETHSSTLTKQENKLLIKNKLEQVLRKKDSEEAPNNSFIHSQKQPRRPPKPDHLKELNIHDINSQVEEFSDDSNGGYLSPIKFDSVPNKDAFENGSATFPRGNSTRSSFLNRNRKSYTNLEKRPKVIENNYEEQQTKASARDRPLPPIPVATAGNTYEVDIDFEMEDNDEEQLPEYTPVLDDEEAQDGNHELPEYTPIPDDIEEFDNVKINKEPPVPVNPFKTKAPSNRPLLPVPIKSVSNIHPKISREQKYKIDNMDENSSSEEHLPEYTPVLEEEDVSEVDRKAETNTSLAAQKLLSPFHRPLPPIPPTVVESNQRSKVESNTIISASAVNKSDSLKVLSKSTKLLKLRAEVPTPSIRPEHPNNIPKPPLNLPKPPTALPESTAFLLETEDQVKCSNKVHHRPLPPLPSPEIVQEPMDNTELNGTEEDVPYYSQVDITTEPCYRETDRKGARMLLTGLADGAFVIRPSREDKYICTLSIIHKTNMFNVGVEKDTRGILQFRSATPDFNPPVFYCVGDIISYYSRHPLYLKGEDVILRSILPANRR